MVYVALGNFYNAKLDSVREMLQHDNTVLGWAMAARITE